jgi:PAS domain S-box-containing protein
MVDTEEKYRALITLAPDPIFFVDTSSGTIKEVSDQAIETMGYDRDELIGMDIVALHPPDESEAYKTLFEQTMESGTIRTTTLPDGSQTHLVTSRGAKIPVELHARTVPMADETWVYSIARDITEQKEYESQLESKQDQLEVLNQVVRHDLRNDLQVIDTYADLLEAQVDGDGEEYLQTIQEFTRHANEFTQTAADLAEVIRNPESDQQTVSLMPILEEQRAEAADLADDATITIADSPTALDVVATEMLESVFRNLFTNAILHNDADEPTVTVTVEAHDDEVDVHVADNGPGIPDASKETMFQKGEKGLESNGSGLGLYLTQTLVQGYGGNIWVEDNEPRGSVFTVCLPQAGT